MLSSKELRIAKGFEKLFEFDNIEDQVRHETQMIMFRFLSEIENVLEEKGMNKTQLSKMIGCSPVWLTQIWRGDKKLNFETVAKIQIALNIKFNIYHTNTSINLTT